IRRTAAAASRPRSSGRARSASARSGRGGSPCSSRTRRPRPSGCGWPRATRWTRRSRASCASSTDAGAALPDRGGGARRAGLTAGEEAGEPHAVGRRQVLEGEPRHLARGADDAGGAGEDRAAGQDELELHEGAGGERAEPGADGEAADADVAGDELALLAERLAGLVELADRRRQRDRQTRGL